VATILTQELFYLSPHARDFCKGRIHRIEKKNDLCWPRPCLGDPIERLERENLLRLLIVE
jgi:hypothetical protein